MMSRPELRGEGAGAARFLAPDHTDPRVCGLCLRGWGSKIVTPPEGYFSLLNTRTGKFHGSRRDKTACGLRVTGAGWRRV